MERWHDLIGLKVETLLKFDSDVLNSAVLLFDHNRSLHIFTGINSPLKGDYIPAHGAAVAVDLETWNDCRDKTVRSIEYFQTAAVQGVNIAFTDLATLQIYTKPQAQFMGTFFPRAGQSVQLAFAELEQRAVGVSKELIA